MEGCSWWRFIASHLLARDLHPKVKPSATIPNLESLQLGGATVVLTHLPTSPQQLHNSLSVLFNYAVKRDVHIASVIDKNMIMKLSWNDSDRRKPKNSRKKKVCQRHFVHNKSQTKWPWIVPWLPPWQAREISIITVRLWNENQTQVLYTRHQARWLLNSDHDPKIFHIKQCVQVAQALNLAHSLSMAQILLKTQHISLAQIAHSWFQNGPRIF